MRSFYFLLMALICTACYQDQEKYESLKGYDLNRPEVFKMHRSLFEISGIAFYQKNPDTLYAEQDEAGAVYIVRLGEKKSTKVTFKKHDDFEDIAICDDIVVMLRSDGTLFTFPIQEVWQRNITTDREWSGLLPKGEYEGMYADSKAHKIYVLCKSCAADTKKEQQVSGYIFKLDEQGTLAPSGTFQIDTKDISGKFVKGEHKLKPSALTFNEQTNEWYILSSINKMLVVTDKDFQIKTFYRLDPRLYIQPEGIAFDRDHTLYISNEGSVTKMGTVFRFRYQPDFKSE